MQPATSWPAPALASRTMAVTVCDRGVPRRYSTAICGISKFMSNLYLYLRVRVPFQSIGNKWSTRQCFPVVRQEVPNRRNQQEMSGQIPKYGTYFALEPLPYAEGQDLASRRYVLKSDNRYSIRSTRDSKHWTIFIAGPAGAQFPLGKPRDTLGRAMADLLALRQIVTD